MVGNFKGADLAYTGVRIQTLTLTVNSCRSKPTTFLSTSTDCSKPTSSSPLPRAFHRALWDEVGRYDEGFPVYEDWEFLIRATHQREVRALTTYSAISRAFTGDIHLRKHSANEPDECARCRTALQWKHRHLRNQAGP